MRVTGASMSASSNQDIANLGVPTSENGDDKKRKPVELNSARTHKKNKELDKASATNSFMTLAIPTVDQESTVRQSASKLILKVDESGPKAIQPVDVNKQVLGASFNFGSTNMNLQ